MLFRFSNCIVLSVCHILNESLVRAGPQDQRVDMCNGGGGSCRTASIKPVGENTDENIDGKRQYLRFLSTLEREGECDRCIHLLNRNTARYAHGYLICALQFH